MENRGTGLSPNRVPGEWMKRPLEIGKEPAQGAAKTSRPTSRSLETFAVSTEARSTDFMQQILSERPGVIAQRALAPIPGEVQTMFAAAPGGFVEQLLVGGSFEAQKFKTGGGGNTSDGSKGVI